MKLIIDKERQIAKQRLTKILEELYDLGNEAEELIETIFPEVSSLVAAYNLCQFGVNCNPYSESLEKVVKNLEIEFEEETEENKVDE